jgi:predicted nucleic acid-binding protein
VSRRSKRFWIVPRHVLAALCRSTPQWTTYGQSVIVVDASVLAVALGDDGTYGSAARRRLANETLAAPEIVDLEVVSVWRRLVAAKQMTARRAGAAVIDLRDLPLRRAPHRPLLDRIWELRHSVTSYDAAYVALAEALNAVLITADAKLARAPRTKCEIEVVSDAN